MVMQVFMPWPEKKNEKRGSRHFSLMAFCKIETLEDLAHPKPSPPMATISLNGAKQTNITRLVVRHRASPQKFFVDDSFKNSFYLRKVSAHSNYRLNKTSVDGRENRGEPEACCWCVLGSRHGVDWSGLGWIGVDWSGFKWIGAD